MASITVIGSLNMDLTVASPRMPAPGETVFGSGFLCSPGGKGANQAVAAARLGALVSMVGCVGDDAFGRELAANLSGSGVDTRYVLKTREKPTGAAVIIVAEADNTIVVDPGANFCLTPAMIENAEDCIKACDTVLLQMEIPPETVENAIRLAKKHGKRVLLNPAPAGKIREDLLKMADILTPNRSECEALTGLPADTADQAKAAAKHLLDLGIPCVAVTLGSEGAVFGASGRVWHEPAFPVEAVDTTAAGDAFSAALAVAVSGGQSFEAAADFALAAAALTVTKRGAQRSLPAAGEVASFLTNIPAGR
ncbi:MAG TPA: ribokinase [Clostridiales bacterium]|nr:MAG: Ribokinase [Firmicutes bacterium ADurb.Bin262]HOU09260.1 ribokinase [Clostridiales bacterium]HQK74376.1 ribokinase [Clostridiales bacterium]